MKSEIKAAFQKAAKEHEARAVERLREQEKARSLLGRVPFWLLHARADIVARPGLVIVGSSPVVRDGFFNRLARSIIGAHGEVPASGYLRNYPRSRLIRALHIPVDLGASLVPAFFLPNPVRSCADALFLIDHSVSLQTSPLQTKAQTTSWFHIPVAEID